MVKKSSLSARTSTFVIEKKSVDVEARTITAVITTTTPDRDGDIIESRGLDFINFLKNPVVLWAHDLSMPPVGKVLSVSVKNNRVEATVKFADTPFALEVFKLYAEGYLNAWSLGFLPKVWERIESDGKAQGEPVGFHVQEAEVIELSAVPVPANPDALNKALESIESEEMREAFRKGWEGDAVTDEDKSESSKAEELVFKASSLSLPSEAFRKTISDRAKSRFPVVFEPVGKNGPEVIVEYEAVKKDGDCVVEAKLLSVKLAVLAPDTKAPGDGESGREVKEEDSANDDKRPPVGTPDSHQMESAVQEARANLALVDAELFDLLG